MELLQTIALLCQLSNGVNYPEANRNIQTVCQQYYVNCVSKHRAKSGAVEALERCILEK